MIRKQSEPKDGVRAWQRMLSGRRLDLIDPSPLDIEIEDIAHGLARVARWNGQTLGAHAFSVAQHSIYVEHLCTCLEPQLSPSEQLIALLHDAPEYVIGDMISPFKALLGGSYKDVEKRLEQSIHIRFGLPGNIPVELKKLIKRADHISAWFEATQLAGFSANEADQFFGHPPPSIKLKLDPLSPPEAQSQFLERHCELLNAMDAGVSKV